MAGESFFSNSFLLRGKALNAQRFKSSRIMSSVVFISLCLRLDLSYESSRGSFAIVSLLPLSLSFTGVSSSVCFFVALLLLQNVSFAKKFSTRILSGTKSFDSVGLVEFSSRLDFERAKG